ncbi:glutamate racemase [Leptospira haakeii]|uniref:Glutamate racemase n=1 Tax=Leptospira haakeii TaxID=2023198 RepID=A0ABX4PKJ0_9LEPT|nr:glutamate racemase [Leptospira haakeii]PKA14908.1 glutamate racemase [Leptospira haakeii]PKA20439.1 glutamate racemase [Leptospira haakeii]
MENNKERVPKIGVMDSGMGGLSVLKELLDLPYSANFLYYGDLAHAPYGEKQTSEVLELTRNVCHFFLKEEVDAILLACNTATSASASKLRAELSVPVFGMEPAIKPALLAHPGEKIALLATSVTHREEKLQDLKSELGASGRVVHLNCDGLATLVDHEKWEEARLLLKNILKIPQEQGIRALVLGCTHYVFLKNEIKDLYPEAILHDGNQGTVRHLVRSLHLDEKPGKPNYTLFFSSVTNREETEGFASRLLRKVSP